jgi:hypothetical protein
MALTRNGYILLGAILLLFAAVNALALTIPWASPLGLTIRLAALNGFLAMAIATMMTPFLLPVARAFGRPFLRVHHVFAVLGIVLITLHPVALGILRVNPLVLLPSAASPWVINLGRALLIVLYIAVVASLLRTRWKQWRYLHAFLYAVLVLALVHAYYLGTDFGTGAILAIYLLLGAGVVLSLALGLRKKYLRMKTAGTPPRPAAP